MKKLGRLFLSGSLLAIFGVLCSAAAPSGASLESPKGQKVAIVNFKTCVEGSKLGQKEQAGFDAMKKQMESVLVEKEKSLTEIASKFNDIDYLDSLSPEAERELKDKFRSLNQDFNQQQNQFYQVLSQTNVKVVQKLTDAITKAATDYAKKNQIALVINEDSAFFASPDLDISQQVIQGLDASFEKESKDVKSNVALPLDMK